ncbi:tetraacyldisaccharide 4'-kinase [Flavobacteriales bacterium]|nr:tetraacyldisaccharide 4'-kinase [Flavobacteriales bacterium]
MPWYRHLLWPFAILYGIAVWIRNRLFDFGVFSSEKFDVPVICVGNLEAGGTGKSPLVNYIVALLVTNNRNVAVLSRGYGRSTKGFLFVKETGKASEVGDEPLQAKLRFPEVTVAVCENRVKGIQQLLETAPKPDVIVMDDGFQHRWIKPSLSILVSPSTKPFWRNQLLPVGTLREGKSESKRADVFVVGGEDSLVANAGFDVETFHSKVVSGALVQFSGNRFDVSELQDVVLFSGIANHERFEDLVANNYKVLEHLKFADHHNYSVSDLSSLRKLDSFGTTVNAVITTEKDAARLANSTILQELKNVPMFYLPINIEFGEMTSEFDKMIVEHGKYA